MKKLTIIFNIIHLINAFSQYFYCIEQYRNDTLIEQYYFNSRGQLVKQIQQIFTPNGKDVVVREWEYKDSLLASEKITTGPSDVLQYVYLYDENNRVVRIKWYGNNRYEGKDVFIYQGNLLERRVHYGPKQIQWEKIFTYDSSQHVTQMDFIIYMDSLSSYQKSYHYLRDTNGNILHEFCLSGNDTLHVVKYSYDKMGRKIEQTTFIPGVGEVLAISWKYQKRLHRPVVEIHRQNNYVVYKEFFSYSKDGRILKKQTIEYRNFSGKMKPVKNKYRYKYYKQRKV
ncbi:MAG: hypothetical protein N2Z72_02045 [Bacteroidales bacterium]|nr:hypothetical protein [Bacteroidales bacterium]